MRIFCAAALIASLGGQAYTQEAPNPWRIIRYQDKMTDFAEYQAQQRVPGGSMVIFCPVSQPAIGLVIFRSEEYLSAKLINQSELRSVQYRLDTGQPVTTQGAYYIDEHSVALSLDAQKQLESAITPESKNLLVRLKTWNDHTVDLDFDVSGFLKEEQELAFACRTDPDRAQP
jgi:hypothetical protein